LSSSCITAGCDFLFSSKLSYYYLAIFLSGFELFNWKDFSKGLGKEEEKLFSKEVLFTA
jgi:hypothetical protein